MIFALFTFGLILGGIIALIKPVVLYAQRRKEGKIHGLPYNCTICGETFVGTILLVGVRGDAFKSVPLAEMGDARLLLPSLFYDEEAEA